MILTSPITKDEIPAPNPISIDITKTGLLTISSIIVLPADTDSYNEFVRDEPMMNNANIARINPNDHLPIIVFGIGSPFSAVNHSDQGGILIRCLRGPSVWGSQPFGRHDVELSIAVENPSAITTHWYVNDTENIEWRPTGTYSGTAWNFVELHYATDISGTNYAEVSGAKPVFSPASAFLRKRTVSRTRW